MIYPRLFAIFLAERDALPEFGVVYCKWCPFASNS